MTTPPPSNPTAELTAILNDALKATVFRTTNGQELPLEALPRAFSGAEGRTEHTQAALTAQPVIAEDEMEPLMCYLRANLQEYITGDEIGLRFSTLGSGGRRIYTDWTSYSQDNHDIPTLAKSVLSAAGYLGAERAAELIQEWKDGKPRQSKSYTTLVGVHVDAPVEIIPGVSLRQLPMLETELPNTTPDRKYQKTRDILGRTALVVDVATSSVFFKPPQKREDTPDAKVSTPFGHQRIEQLATALSLVCNNHVARAWGWYDLLETKAFEGTEPFMALQNSPKYWSRSGTYTTTDRDGNTVLHWMNDQPPDATPPEQIRKAWEILPDLVNLMSQHQRFKIAVERWVKASDPDATPADRMIDLRVALEALYITSDNRELGFRLSLTGANHLGEDLEERKSIKKALNDFYGQSSRAIHGTAPDKMRAKATAITDKAANLCRKGILKVVDAKARPDWDEILLR